MTQSHEFIAGLGPDGDIVDHVMVTFTFINLLAISHHHKGLTGISWGQMLDMALDMNGRTVGVRMV